MLKFPSANEMCCVQGVVDITMAELPTMPFTHNGGEFLHADFSKSAESGRFWKICKPGGISASTCRQLSSGRFHKICIWGEFLQAHVGNLGNCPVADFGKSANWGEGEFLQAHVSNLGNCPVADFGKSANGGGISASTCK